MASFRFTLEPLYEHRQRLEELSQREFHEVTMRLKAEEEKLGHLRELLAKSHTEADEKKERGETGDLGLYHSYMEGLKRHIKAQERMISEIGALLERKRVELVEASRNKKVVEVMKERSFNDFNQETAKREQKEADELTIARFRRGDED